MTREAALQALAASMHAEEEARTALRHAMADQARLLAELRRMGVPTTAVAHRLSAAQGVALQIADRLRLARCLRKRAQRETRRRAELGPIPGSRAVARPGSDRRATTPATEGEMPKIVKRTVTTTEEYMDDRDLAGLESEDDDAESQESDDGDEAEPDEQSERKRRR